MAVTLNIGGMGRTCGHFRKEAGGVRYNALQPRRVINLINAASGDELTPGGREVTPAAAQQLPELTAVAGRLERRGQGVDSGGQRSLDSPGGGMVAEVGVPAPGRQIRARVLN